MKKQKLKWFVMPSLVIILGIISITVGSIISSGEEKMNSDKAINYVSETILSRDLAVLNTTDKVIYPYLDPSVTVGKNYYNYKGDAEEQEKAIVYHENTYMQNSGIDFINKELFDVVAVLDGTVTNIKEDELLGKIIEISHGNDYISVYQSLSDIKVKKGDTVSQGQVIGVSGTNKIDGNLGNHLHFEFYAAGQIVNPSNYLDKELSNNNED